MTRKGSDADSLDDELDILTRQQFYWIYLQRIWQTGNAGRTVSRANLERRKGIDLQL
jgi:hypothetical protein